MMDKPLERTASARLIDQHSVVLVSGGARGITAQCIIKLAEAARSKFILLGRSAYGNAEPIWASLITETLQQELSEGELKRRIMQILQSQGERATPQRVQQLYDQINAQREITHTLEAVRKAGGQAEYVSVDVTDGEALRQKLAEPVQRFGPVTGIIHGAGTLADKRIEDKTEKDFERVYSPKVNGLENLLNIVSVDQLRFLVLFSSVVGIYGNVGQADYAIANETLNKTAYLIKRDYPKCRVISINWGPWDAGMVNPSLMKAFIERNIQLIPSEVGASLLVEELSADTPDVIQVVIGSPPPAPIAPQPEESDREPREYQIQRHLTLEANPFLYDHQIGNHPVLPATCAATWVVNTCEQLYPGYTFLSIENFKVLKGIVFNETLAGSYTLDLKETERVQDEKVEFDAVIWSQTHGKKFYHYSLHLTLGRDPARAFRDRPAIPLPQFPPNGQPIPGEKLYKDGTLFHGPTFQGVQQVLSIDSQRLVMLCRLGEIEERIQGQFQVQNSNPFIYDAIVQSLLIWTQYHYQAPCLPSRLGKLEQYKPISFNQTIYVTMELEKQTETSVIGNVTVQDEKGEVYVRFIELEGTMSRQLKRLFRPTTGL